MGKTCCASKCSKVCWIISALLIVVGIVLAIFVGVTYSNEYQNTIINDLYLKGSLAFGVALIAGFIYSFLRFKHIGRVAGALSFIITAIHDILLTYALTVICSVCFKLNISEELFTNLAFVMGLSIINSLLVLNAVKDSVELRKIDKNASICHTKCSVMRTIIMYSALIVVFFVAVVVAIKSSVSFVIPMVIGVLVCIYSASSITSQIWAKMGKNNK